MTRSTYIGIGIGIIIIVLIGVVLALRGSPTDESRQYRSHRQGIVETIAEDPIRRLHETSIDGRVVDIFDITGNGRENILFSTGSGGVHSNEFEIWEFDGNEYTPLMMEYPSGDHDTARLSEGNSVFSAFHYDTIPQERLIIQYQEHIDNGQECFAYPYLWNDDDRVFRLVTDDTLDALLRDGCMRE